MTTRGAEISSNFDVGACIFEMCLQKHSTYHWKAHRISNNMVKKLHAQRQGGKVTVIIYVTTFSSFDGHLTLIQAWTQ